MSKCKYDVSEDCNSNKDCLSCILGKIRAEIMSLDYIDEDKYEGISISPMIYRDDVLEIIDKYKTKIER